MIVDNRSHRELLQLPAAQTHAAALGYSRARTKTASSASCCFLPPGIFRLQFSLERGAGVFDLLDLGFMKSLGLFQRGFGFRDCQFALLASLLPRGRFHYTLSFPPPSFSLERTGCSDGSFIPEFARLWLFCRRRFLFNCLLDGGDAKVSR